MRLVDYIMERISQVGLDSIFMVTGRGALYLTDAVARSEKISGYSLHHEQSAVFAAAAYADYSGGIGCCVVSTGCGSTNAITGVLNAWQDGIPVLILSGQHELEETTNYTGLPVRTYGQQQADIIELVKPITKYANIIKCKSEIAAELDKALYYAMEGRKGPVWLDIPLDLQSAVIDSEVIDQQIELPEEEQKIELKEFCRKIEDAIRKSQRPVAIIGSGIKASKTKKEFLDFVEQNKIPFVYTASSCDFYDFDHPLNIGSIGVMGCSRSGAFCVQNADLIIILGNRMNSMITGPVSHKFGRAAKIFMVDIDPYEMQKTNLKVDDFLNADLRLFFESLVSKKIKNNKVDSWGEKCLSWKENLPFIDVNLDDSNPVDLHYLSEIISDNINDEIIVTDSGTIELVMPNNIRHTGKSRHIHPTSQGSMGFSLGGSIGAAIASGKNVICIVGDGSVMMNVQELAMISYLKLPISIIVVNNGMYAVIRKRQKELFRRRTIGTDATDGVPQANFKEISKAFDLNYELISNNKEMSKMSSLLARNSPQIIEVYGLEIQDYITTAHAKTQEGTYSLRPIEDQKPFIDRELFFAHMIIEPIDQ
jgi:acetolactate synthase-1/2/3 large subunit